LLSLRRGVLAAAFLICSALVGQAQDYPEFDRVRELMRMGNGIADDQALIAEFEAQAASIADDVALIVDPRCNDRQFLQDGTRDLALLRDKFNALMFQYNNFKEKLGRMEVRVLIDRGYDPSDRFTPRDNNFWTAHDINIAKTQTAIDNLQASLNADVRRPCPQQSTGTGQAWPKPREIKRRDPGKMPPWPVLVLPGGIYIPGHGPFCSPSERDAFIKADLDPALDKVTEAERELTAFESVLLGPLHNAEAELLAAANRPIKPANPPQDQVEIQREFDDEYQKSYDIGFWKNEVGKYQAAIDWAKSNHERLNKLHDQLLAAVAGLTVNPALCPTANALAGLQRPVWDAPSLTSPGFFCSEAERQTFIDRLTAAIRAANAAQGPVIDYRRQINERQIALRGGKLDIGGTVLQPDDPTATKALQAESDWADGQLKRMRDTEDQLVKRRTDAYAIPVKDCSQTVAPPRADPGAPAPRSEAPGMTAPSPPVAATPPSDAPNQLRVLVVNRSYGNDRLPPQIKHAVLDGLQRPTWEYRTYNLELFCTMQELRSFLAAYEVELAKATAAEKQVGEYQAAITRRFDDLRTGKLVVAGTRIDANDAGALAALTNEQNWLHVQVQPLHSSVMGMTHARDQLANTREVRGPADCAQLRAKRPKP
jgi:hypothetical protein